MNMFDSVVSTAVSHCESETCTKYRHPDKLACGCACKACSELSKHVRAPGENIGNLAFQLGMSLIDVCALSVVQRDVARAWLQQGGEPPEFLRPFSKPQSPQALQQDVGSGTFAPAAIHDAGPCPEEAGNYLNGFRAEPTTTCVVCEVNYTVGAAHACKDGQNEGVQADRVEPQIVSKQGRAANGGGPAAGPVATRNQEGADAVEVGVRVWSGDSDVPKKRGRKKKLRRVSHSELACFRRCPREHHYRFVKRRESRVTGKALRIGTLIDEAVKALYQGKEPDLTKLGPAERAMVRAYAVRWKNELRMDRVDIPFKVVIEGVEIIGEMDALRAEFLTELKTSSFSITPGAPYWRNVAQIDPQVSMYLLVAKAMGWPQYRLMYDVLYKPQLRQKGNEADDDFENRILLDMADRIEFYFQRQEIVRLEDEHAAHVRDMKGIVHLMQAVSEMDEAPRNVDACFKFNRACDFLEVCLGERELSDETFYQESEYLKKREAIHGSAKN